MPAPANREPCCIRDGVRQRTDHEQVRFDGPGGEGAGRRSGSRPHVFRFHIVVRTRPLFPAE